MFCVLSPELESLFAAQHQAAHEEDWTTYDALCAAIHNEVGGTEEEGLRTPY